MGTAQSAKTELFGQWLSGNMVIADQGKSTGRRVFVHSGTGSDAGGYGASPERPVATLDYAIGLCTANKHDVVYVMPGHAESYGDGEGFAADMAGVRIVGLGRGADRPTFTFAHADAACTISAGGVTLQNLLFVAGIDSIAAPLTISGADCTLRNIEWRDATDIEFVRGLVTTAAADRLTLEGCFYNGYTAGDACVNAIRLIGVDGAVIRNCRFHGLFSTAAVEMITTKCTKVVVERCSFLNTGTALTADIVDTGGIASTWEANECFDLVGGYAFSGGDGSALAADSVAAVVTLLGTPAGADLATDIASIVTLLGTPAGADVSTDIAAIVTLLGTPAGADLATDIASLVTLLGTPAGADVSTDIASVVTLLGTPAGADIAADIAALVALIGTPAGADLVADVASILALIGTPAGVDLVADIATLATTLGTPAGADMAADIAAVLAAAEKAQGAGMVYNGDNYLAVAVDLTQAAWNTDATHEVLTVTGLVRLRILIEVTDNVVSGGDTATLTLGHEGNAAAWIAATAEDELDTGDLWYDATPATKEDTPANAIIDRIVNGLDVGYEIDNEACTGGSFVVHCWWEPLNATASVLAGDGSALA